MDPAIPQLVLIALAILVVGMVLKRFGQSSVVAYILAGMLVGPFGVAVVSGHEVVARFGAIGVLLLVFFIGMELPLRDLVKHWRAPILGTALEVIISVLAVWPIAIAWGWPFKRAVFIGFVISMSSTAVILNLLRSRGELSRPIGRDVTSITVAQDLAVIPMLLILGLLAGEAPDLKVLSLQGAGGAAALALFFYIVRRGEIRLPFARFVKDDAEMQVFAGFLTCFGLAWLTGLLHLSAALGAFLGGMVIAASRQADWVRERLDPFRVLFVGVFFLSVGMLIDLRFLMKHAVMILALVALVLVLNTFINALVLRTVGHGWRASFYGGALLAQIGEFSFVLAAVGFQNQFISEYAYQTTIAVICMTLLVSPVWISLFRWLVGPDAILSTESVSHVGGPD